MKKYTVLLICFFVALPLCAQRDLRKVERAVVGASGKSVPGKKNPGKMGKLPGSVRSGPRTDPATPNLGPAHSPAGMPNRTQGNKMLSAPSKSALNGPHIELQAPAKRQYEIDQAMALLEENADLTEQKWAEMFETGIGKSVLSIPNVAAQKNPELLTEEGKVPAYSMTIIKEKGEIFGVIPTHALPANKIDADAQFGVMKEFQAKLKLADGSEKLIPGRVVQVSPEAMLDISLVKFNPEDENLLKPLELADKDATGGEKLLSYGSANGNEVYVPRTAQRNSLISVRTDLIKIKGDRQGFCGSPLLDKNNQVKGIHTGSWNGSSYGTHASFVKKLIEAYRNNGEATYDVILDGRKIAELNVDEYIAGFGMLDEDLSLIFKEDGVGSGWGKFKKYSETRIRDTLKAMPQAKYLVVHVRKVFWDKTQAGMSYLVEDRSLASLYESQTKELIIDLEMPEGSWTETDFKYFYMKNLDGMPIK